jgi:hypothetical protein
VTDPIEKPQKQKKAIERVTIGASLKEKLAQLTAEANEVLGGVASVTKTDVVNVLLRGHDDALSTEEIKILKESHVDAVKVAEWVSESMKAAAKAGEPVSLQALYEHCAKAFGPEAPRAPSRRMTKAAPKERPSQTPEEPLSLETAKPSASRPACTASPAPESPGI